LIEATTESQIETDVEFAFNSFMPRAILLDVTAIADPDRNAVRVNIIYRPINATEPVETVLLLERVR
jgi:phage baseplate assembly protein W